DIKFAFLIGIFLGIGKAAEAFFLSFIIGALLLAPFMIFMKKSGKAPVPFGTFMAIGAFIAMLFGDYLRDWFFSLY
ncbi:MAG: prepilin peptidase, partial [bacterium]|nr:prepilin peptidase [bacterium]